MTIQSVNLTVPGGDTPRSAFTKINTNFSDTNNAASRLVGTGIDNIPAAQNIPSLSMRKYGDIIKTGDLNALSVGSVITTDAGATVANTQTIANMPPLERYCIVYTMAALVASHVVQIAVSIFYRGAYKRMFDGTTWTEWEALSNNRLVYDTTTAAGANVAVDSNGYLKRSTSSERYKDIIADLELDDAAYANAMQLAPIVYRSTANADNPDYHYYSFSAEELGAYDPAFTLWRNTETVTDDEGNTTEQPLDERQADGINLNAIVAFLHATNVKQGKLIKELQDQVNALKPAQQPNN